MHDWEEGEEEVHPQEKGEEEEEVHPWEEEEGVVVVVHPWEHRCPHLDNVSSLPEWYHMAGQP